MARLRLSRVPQFLVGASVLAAHRRSRRCFYRGRAVTAATPTLLLLAVIVLDLYLARDQPARRLHPRGRAPGRRCSRSCRSLARRRSAPAQRARTLRHRASATLALKAIVIPLLLLRAMREAERAPRGRALRRACTSRSCSASLLVGVSFWLALAPRARRGRAAVDAARAGRRSRRSSSASSSSSPAARPITQVDRLPRCSRTASSSSARRSPREMPVRWSSSASCSTCSSASSSWASPSTTSAASSTTSTPTRSPTLTD